jgi:Protein of unknown function (DUF5672)
MPLSLQQVTLVAVDTQVPVLAAEALLRSMAHIDFGRVMLFTHDWVPRRVIPQLELVEIPPLATPADRSHFVLRRLPSYIRSSHALLVQWDGFVAHPAAWNHEFLTQDYVGAVWPGQPEGQSVGSGGFSLRSRRMLVAGQDPRIQVEHPEDEVLCRLERARLERDHGVNYATPALARRFAAGAEVRRTTAFGFHGVQHLPSVLDEKTLLRWLKLLPEAFFRSTQARGLVRALLLRRMPTAARQLLDRRQALGETDTGLLGTAASVLGLLGPRAS